MAMVNQKNAISVNHVYELTNGLLYDIEDFFRCTPRTGEIPSAGLNDRLLLEMENARRILLYVALVIGISEKALYATLYTIRKWHERKEWTRELSETAAARLLAYMNKLYPAG